ncbi:phage Gp37/Gp68 family protein [Paenibacillus sp. FSL R5-0527]|uniref:DUF5131 family protein n=1 Tax=Paenibacillus sp. FSL R5-0527 TaxID=2975321 RepID=UPI00097A52CC|nr:hypothetical protein BK140_09280 [Paenibacillus macerans]
MSDKTGIEWADATWNPVTGCTKVSEGCRNCYAKTFTERFEGTPGHYFETGFKITLRPEKLDQPLRWRRPRRIFVNSMSDLFHQDVPDDYIDQVFAVMALCPEHTFQILTKRPERMFKYMTHPGSPFAKDKLADISPYMEQWGWMSPEDAANIAPPGSTLPKWPEWPLPNVWLGVSVENQQAADERIPMLLQTPAAVRFLSCEQPLLGPVDLESVRGTFQIEHPNNEGYGVSAIDGIDWVIVGGESGSKARPMHPDWARSLRDQCQATGVPFFFKQWGEWSPGSNFDDHIPASVAYDFGTRSSDDELVWKVGKNAAGRLLNGRTWDEFPGEGMV